MRRRDFIAAVAGSAAAWPMAGHAQQPSKMRRIGVLMSFAVNDPEGLSRAAALENGLRKLGWIKGHNLRIEYRWAGNPEVLRTDAAELLGMASDLILANSTPVMAVLREQRHADRLHQVRVLDRDEVAGDPQASGAACHAGSARLQPADRTIRRLVLATH